MIRRRTVMLLGAVTLAATAAAVAAVVERTAETRTSVQAERPYPTLEARAGEVSQVRLERAADAAPGTVTLTRRDADWVVEEKDGYPARTDLVRKLLFDLGQIELIERKTADADRFGRLDLADLAEKGSNATRVVVAAGAGDPLVDVHVGKRRESLSGGKPMVYVRRTGEQQTYLAEGELDLRGGPVQWLLREIVNVPRETIVAAQLTGASGEVLRLERAGNDFRIVDLAESRRVDSQYTVNNAATVVDRLLFDDVRSAQGLDFASGPGAGSFTTRDGLTVVLEMASDPAGDAQAAPWLRVVLSLAPEATEAARTFAEAARARTEGWAYRVSSFDLERLRATAEALTKPAQGS